MGCVSTPSCDSGTCLKPATMVIPSENSILPCGVTGTVNIGTNSDLTACETTITWYLDSYDSVAFEDVSINSSGVLEFTSTNSAERFTPYKFIGHVTCSGTYLSAYFTITVYIKDGCFGVTCPDGESCSPCDGTCGAIPDVEVS